MGALFSNLDEAQKIRHQRDVLNQGIEDFLDGNYDNPRRVRPGQCGHGVWYNKECAECDAKHFSRVLMRAGEVD